jgi:hypothetical protein
MMLTRRWNYTTVPAQRRCCVSSEINNSNVFMRHTHTRFLPHHTNNPNHHHPTKSYSFWAIKIPILLSAMVVSRVRHVFCTIFPPTIAASSRSFSPEHTLDTLLATLTSSAAVSGTPRRHGGRRTAAACHRFVLSLTLLSLIMSICASSQPPFTDAVAPHISRALAVSAGMSR